MVEITLNGQRRTLPEAISVQQLLHQLGYATPRGVAVEVNREVVPALRHAERRLAAGDAVEVTTLVGGGSPETPAANATGSLFDATGSPVDTDLRIGTFRFRSRL